MFLTQNLQKACLNVAQLKLCRTVHRTPAADSLEQGCTYLCTVTWMMTKRFSHWNRWTEPTFWDVLTWTEHELHSEQKHFSAAAGRLIESVTHWQSGLSSLIRALSWSGDCSVLCHRRSLSVIQLITSDRSQCVVGVSMARWFLVWRVPHTGRTNRRSGGILLKSKCPISTSGWMCRGETEIWVCWTWDCVWVCGVCCSDSWTCWRPATQQVNITFLIKCSSLWFVLFSTLIAD